MPRTIRMSPFLMIPSVPASASTWFCVHVDVWYFEPGAGGTSARMIGTPALPAASIAGDSATESAGLTMIALTPWRTMSLIAEIWLSGVDCARLGGMLTCRLPVRGPWPWRAANSVFRLREDVVVVRVRDADRDVADLPRRLRLDLLRGPRARDDLVRVAAVDVLQRLRHRREDAALVRRTDRDGVAAVRAGLDGAGAGGLDADGERRRPRRRRGRPRRRRPR